MTTPSPRQSDAPIYDLRVHKAEREPLPSTARAQLFAPISDVGTSRSLVERIRTRLQDWFTPKN